MCRRDAELTHAGTRVLTPRESCESYGSFPKNASKDQGIRIVPLLGVELSPVHRRLSDARPARLCLCLDHQTRWKECGFFMPVDKYATCSHTLYEFIWYHWQSFPVHMGNLTVEICRNVRTICMHASSIPCERPPVCTNFCQPSSTQHLGSCSWRRSSSPSPKLHPRLGRLTN